MNYPAASCGKLDPYMIKKDASNDALQFDLINMIGINLPIFNNDSR